LTYYSIFSSNPVNVDNYKPGTSGGIGGVGADGGGGGGGGGGGVGGTSGPFFFPAKYQITKPTTITATIIQKRVIVFENRNWLIEIGNW